MGEERDCFYEKHALTLRGCVDMMSIVGVSNNIQYTPGPRNWEATKLGAFETGS